MKISNSQMFRNFNNWCLSVITLLFLGAFNTQAQGDALFKAKCATCHQVFKDGTGPKLFEVRQKWEDGGAGDGAIIQWVNNWETAAATDDYAKSISAWSGTAMTAFPDLSEEQIYSIFDWVDTQEPVIVSAETASNGSDVVEEESSMGWILIILGVIFFTIIVAVGGVRRQLKAAAASDSEGYSTNMSYWEEFKHWCWLYRKQVGLGTLVLVIAAVTTLFLSLYSIGVVENYHPSQPIEFPHSVHAGTNGIDCKYCHNSVTKSKTAGLPTVNVCMNCHKQITGSKPGQEEKIKNIYAAAGWDPAGPGKYTGETKEIIWNKVHVLPDHVYFNHKQHVVVGGIDCKQCHGDMTTRKETAKVHSIDELNKVEGNIQLTRPTLTMGWCIECHQEKEISLGSLKTKKDGYYDEIHNRLMEHDKGLYGDYLEDGKVTVKELGGWECAKCHY